MKVSVIMTAYQECERFIRESIESILNQTYSDFEFIIVLDDPNNHQIISVVNEYMKLDNRIQFIINESNLGLALSCNKALKISKGKYICRMDADDVSLRDRIEKQIKYLEDHNYDMIGGLTNVIDEENNLLYPIKKIPTDPRVIKKVLKYNQCIAHPTWFAKKEVFDEVDGYRDVRVTIDYDLIVRAVLKGFIVANMNELVLNYRMTKKSISRNNLLVQNLYFKYMSKCYSKGYFAEITDIKKYVEKNCNEKKMMKYTQANTLFNDALEALNKRNYFKVIGNCIRLLFVSSQYLNKISRLVIATLYS